MTELRVIAFCADGVERDVTEAAQILVDALYQSMDWGSGFLDYPEVCALRKMAIAIGVDPEHVTPPDWPKNWSRDDLPCSEAIAERLRGLERASGASKYDGRYFSDEERAWRRAKGLSEQWDALQ